MLFTCLPIQLFVYYTSCEFFLFLYAPYFTGYTDDVCKYLRDSVPKTMLADLKEFVSNGGSVNTKDKYGASAVSNVYMYDNRQDLMLQMIE